ncbi:MAG TPA: hypothetical protein PK280_20155 [Planctomycetota bacterium]|nr:hypothetical protein [Planctomycetota bacterium]
MLAELAKVRRELVRLTSLVEQRLPRVAAALPKLMTVSQVAEMAGLSIHVVRKAQFEGKLKRQSRCRAGYALADVLDWLDSRKQCPEEYRAYLNAARKARAS